MPGYNVMGICKAALDCVREVPGVRPGPARHSRQRPQCRPAARRWPAAAPASRTCEPLYEEMSPLGRNVTHDEVGRIGAFLLSDMSDGITGEILHVDGGYNIMGSPGRLLDQIKT